MPAHKKLTLQQRALIKNLSKGMSITDAARKAGYSPNSPGQSGSQALENIRLKMPEVLERAGLTDESLIENYLHPALEAHETKFFQKDGLVTDERNVAAWSPRLTALDLAFRLKGSYAPKAEESTTNIGVKIIIPAGVPRPDRTAIEVEASTNGHKTSET